MSAQTKGVDVLEVMSLDSSHACEHRITKSVFDSTRQKMASESVEARAAVAELIEALSVVPDNVMKYIVSVGVDGTRVREIRISEQNLGRLLSALARVRGGA